MIWKSISKLFKTIDFQQVKEYESVQNNGGVGFTHVYLERKLNYLAYIIYVGHSL